MSNTNISNSGKIFYANLGRNNPVFVQILGICSTLAVTNSVRNTFVMCTGLLFTVTCSNFTISIMRSIIPQRVRMIVEIMVISSFVMIVDMLLKAYLPEISGQLGPYVGLIITNCIIMGRAEAFAIANPPGPSAIDGFSAGLGYSYVLLAIAVVRELAGSGTIWGVQCMPAWWTNWTIMIMAPGAFFVLALFIWIVKAFTPGIRNGACSK